MLHLFVSSILNYGCEAWGFLNAECIERINRNFLKHILHVKISTNNYAVYKKARMILLKHRKRTGPNYDILVQSGI